MTVHWATKYGNYIFNLPTKCERTNAYLSSLLNICYMFRRSLRHPLITSQNHLLILSSLEGREIYVGFFFYIFVWQLLKAVCSSSFGLTFRNLASYIQDGHKITLQMPHFIFIQQISVLNILNMLYSLHSFLFKMPFIS